MRVKNGKSPAEASTFMEIRACPQIHGSWLTSKTFVCILLWVLTVFRVCAPWEISSKMLPKHGLDVLRWLRDPNSPAPANLSCTLQINFIDWRFIEKVSVLKIVLLPQMPINDPPTLHDAKRKQPRRSRWKSMQKLISSTSLGNSFMCCLTSRAETADGRSAKGEMWSSVNWGGSFITSQ